MIVYNNELGLLNAYSVLEHIPKLGSKSIYTKDYKTDFDAICRTEFIDN